MDALELRSIVYRRFVETGTAPTRQELGEHVGDIETVDRLLRELHDRHMLVLDERPARRGEIRMALPFATEPTDFRVTADQGAWWANCAWDSLAVLAALHGDGRIASTWSDTGETLELTVTHGQLDHTDGYISFPLPASRWWDDIVFT
jgi:Alkylmercury lyase